MDDIVVIDGKRYTAGNVGGNNWMVKRFEGDDVSDYKESLIAVLSTDPLVAIQAAINRNSWA